MSELRVALVAEGSTDSILIEVALKAILGRHSFILTSLQPEPTRPKLGAGWCGVFKWCREFAGRGFPSFEEDPTLTGFDLFVIHVDADVAGMKYDHGGPAMLEMASSLAALPCEEPCPPASASVQALRARLFSWLGVTQVGPRTILCMPSKAIEAWLAAAVIPEGPLPPSPSGLYRLLLGLECNGNLAAQLAQLPVEQRIEKKARDFREQASTVTGGWERVAVTCTQASRFAVDVRAALVSREQ